MSARTSERHPVLRLTSTLVASLVVLVGCGDPPQKSPSAPTTANAPAPTPNSKPNSTPAAKPIRVGFAQIGAESDWRKANTDSIRNEAEKRGINLTFSDAQQKQDNQLKALRNFIAQGVDVIAFSPVVETGWEPVLKEIKAAGIPVVLTDRAVEVSDESLFVTFIGADFVEEGRQAGTWLAQATGGSGVIVELQGTPGSAPAIDRKKGFEEVVAGHPGMKIVKSQSGEFTRAKGREVMETFLKSPEGPSITALYAHNDDMAIGAIEAIRASGRKPGVDIKIVSIDAVKAAFEAMAAGELNCTIECSPLLGPQLFDAIEAVVAGKTLPRRIVTPAKVYGQATAAADLKTRVY
ncbi:MAG: ABC transporter substrate-binding protein [Phycisphaerae bacterium]|jgi:ABC-type sugar transport system substrate-binding protein|nr:ABC transporter substrate-binding protein [Phycisphaerae bacterium]